MTIGGTDREAMITAKKVTDIDPNFKIHTVFRYDGSWYCTEDLGDDSTVLSCYKIGDKLERFTPYFDSFDTSSFLKAMNDEGYDKHGKRKLTQRESESSTRPLPSEMV